MLPKEQFAQRFCGGKIVLVALSEEGSLFVCLMLTVVTSLRSQNRNVLDFLAESIRASRGGSSSPSLLPV